MNEKWYALWVKPHKETTVLEQMQIRNLQGFLPMVKVNPKNPRAAKFRPFFPGYMFIYVDLDVVGVNQLNWMPGTRGLVSFGGDPAVVPPTLINKLEKQLAQIDKEGGLVFNKLNQGDKVLIKRGPFAGYEAIFDMKLSGNERVQVLLKFLSEHPQPLKLDSADIEKK